MTAAETMVKVNTIRPPYWSDQMPSISRISDPVRIGVPTSRPNCVSLRPRSRLIWTPMMAKIVHTAKHTVKATVESHSARPCSVSAFMVDGAAVLDIRAPFLVTRSARVGRVEGPVWPAT